MLNKNLFLLTHLRVNVVQNMLINLRKGKELRGKQMDEMGTVPAESIECLVEVPNLGHTLFHVSLPLYGSTNLGHLQHSKTLYCYQYKKLMEQSRLRLKGKHKFIKSSQFG